MSGLQEKAVVVTTSEAVQEKAGANATVLTINRPSPSRQGSGQHLPTIHDVDSAHSMTPPATPNNEKTIETTYTISRDDRDMYTDLEAQGLTEQKTEVSVSKKGLLQTKSCVDSAWPGRNHMKAQKKAAKLQRSRCGCWAGLSKLYKGLIITAIILAVLGIALGIGFGISQKVGGTINDGTGNNKHVPTK